MAPFMYFNFRKVLLFYLVLLFFTSSILLLSASSSSSESDKLNTIPIRRLLGVVQDKDQDQDLEQPVITKKKSSNLLSSSSKNQTKNNPAKSNNLSSKNQTKLIKTTTSSSKNQTKLIKTTTSSSKNQTKLAKPANSTNSLNSSLSKIELKKLNSTSSQFKKLNSTSKLKKLNSTKTSLSSAKKTSDLIKLGTPKNKTTKPNPTKQSQIQTDKKISGSSSGIKTQKQSKGPKVITDKKPNQEKTATSTATTNKKPKQPNWLDQEDDADLVAEFRDLPTKFQQTLLPDLEKISSTSKKYITKANKDLTKGFKPIVGNKYAPTIASVVSFAFILIPLLLVSLIVRRIKAYFSLQRVLIFIQAYLSIYFSILCLSSLATGLEPLKFFYATAQSTYVCVMVLQTLAYVLYLLLLLMYLILVFSTDSGLGLKLLGLGQTFVGYAVGLHFYVAVFHRVVLHQPPKANWKVHGIYAACFLVICLLATAEGRKKAYLEDGGEEGKKN